MSKKHFDWKDYGTDIIAMTVSGEVIVSKIDKNLEIKERKRKQREASSSLKEKGD